MKATSDLWNSPNSDATNSSNFSGLPGGGRGSNGTFSGIGDGGDWWSSTEASSNDAWARALNYDSGNVIVGSGNKRDGFSVRCLRD